MDISSLVQTPASSTDQPPRKPYWQVLDEYRQATDESPELKGMSVPEFAAGMGPGYEEGTQGSDNWLRKLSANLDIGLRHFGGHVAGESQRPGYIPYKSLSEQVGSSPEGWNLPEIVGGAARKATAALGGGPEAQRKIGAVGETLPRMGLDVGVGSLAGGIPGVAAASGLSTYGETGRFAPSLLSVGTAALFPKAAELGGQYVLGKLGAKTLAETRPDLLALLSKDAAAEVGGQLVPSGITQSLARVGGAQAGMLGLGLAGETAQTAIRPDETWEDKLKQVGEEFSPSSLAATAVGQLPFTALDLGSVRARPVAHIESLVREDFGKRFTDAYTAERGSPPSQNQIDLAIKTLTERRQPKAETPIGQTLASMGQTPVEIDLKRLVQTTEGEWNMGDAIEATRAAATNMLRAQPELGHDVGQAHDLRLYAAVRAVQSEGATTKQDLAQRAANRFVATLRGDNSNLDRLSPDYARMERDELVRQRNEKSQLATEAEITSKVDPKLADGSDNPFYDPQLATKIALTSGDIGHRLDAGIEKPVVMSARAGTDETLPLPVSIIDSVRGLVPKVGDEKQTEVTSLQKRIADKDAEVEALKTGKTQEELFDNTDVDKATGEAIQLRMMLQDLTGGEEQTPTGKTRAQQLTADATFAARRAALRYNKPVSTDDPNSVRDFYEYVKSAINTAERGWLRERRDQQTVTDAQGKVLTFPDRNTALQRASVLNEGTTDDEGTKYTVPETPRTDGTFHIVRNRYFRSTSLSPAEAGQVEAIHEVGKGEIPFDERTAAEEATTGIPSATLDQLAVDLKQIEREAVTSRFQELAGLNDPGVREGRKAALAQNIIDFVTGLPDSTVERLLRAEVAVEGERLPSIREPALRKARFVKFMQFLRDGGDVSLKVDKSRPGLLKVKGEGNLDAMNDYFGDLGFDEGNRFNRNRVQGLNFFEQFYVLSKFLQKEFVDPRISGQIEKRPTGDFGWVPPGFREQLEQKLTVDWPKDYEKAVGVKQGQWADVPEAVKENAVLMRTREGDIRRFEVTKNPLQTMFVKGTKHDLLTSAGKLVEMFHNFAPDADPGQLKLLKGLVDVSPFIRNLNVGFGIAKDPNVKGYFHTDDVASSAGVLLSPYKLDPTGRNLASLMSPAEIAPHFLHELGHAGTQFAYVNDPAFKAEVDKVYNYVKEHHDQLVEFGAGGKFSQSQLHGLTNPVEMLASVWHDADLQNFLRKINDPFEPLPQQAVGVPVSMFDRVMGLIRSVLRRFVGDEGANSMLARVSELAARGLEAQKGLDLQSRGDIYSQLYARGNIAGDVIRGKLPEPVPKTEESTASRTFLPEQTGQTLESKEFKPLEVDKGEQGVTSELLGRNVGSWKFNSPEIIRARDHEGGNRKLADENNWNKGVFFTQHPQTAEMYADVKGSKREIVKAELNPNARGFLSSDDKGSLLERLGIMTVDKFDKMIDDEPDTFHPKADAMLAKFFREKGFDYYAFDDSPHGADPEIVVLNKNAVTETTGHTLESRANPATVLDSLKSASTYVTEDSDKLWFKPFDDNYFRTTYQPAFGNKMLLKQEGGQWGYEIPKDALSGVGADQLASMPKPKVRSWAPSAFETMKSLFKQQGSSDQAAEALASYNLQFMSLLKNSERAVWGTIDKPNDPSLLAMAWGKSKIGGLTKLAAEQNQIAPTVMHEGAHLAGFHDLVDRYESPDVQAAVGYANKVFGDLTVAERRSILEGLTRLSDQTRGYAMDVYPAAMKDPTEFAAEFMGHVGEALAQVPKPTAYLRDVLRFAPDEVSNVAKLTTLRRTQALDQLKRLIKDQAHSRGVRTDLGKVVDSLAETFRGLSRSALDIAVDQAEFYRMRGLYPDMYKGLLKRASDRLDSFAQTPGEDEPTPRLSGTIFQSRESGLSKDIRDFFNLPDTEGRLPTKPSIWDRTLMQFQQFAEKYPIARSFYDMLANEKGLSRQRQIQLDTALAGAFEGAKSIDDARTKQVANFQRSTPLRDKFSKIALDVNSYGDDKFRSAMSAAEGDVFGIDPNAVTGFLTPQFVDGLFKKYGVAGKDAEVMNTVMDGTRNQVKLVSANIVGSKLASMERMLAEAVVRSTDLTPEAGRQAGKLLSDAVQNQQVDPQKAMQLMDQFSATVPDAEIRGRMFDFAQSSWEGIQRLERFLSLRMPYYMSERRPGQFGLFWKGDDGKVQSRYFADGKTRDNYVKNNDIEPLRQTNPGDKNFGVSEDVFDQLDQLHARMMEKLTGLMGEKDAKQLGPVMDLGSELRNALNARDVLNLTTPRKGAQGREDLDMFDVHQHYIRAVNQSIRARSVREEAQLLFQHPEFANEPLIKQQIQNHVDQVLTPDSKVGRAIVRVNQLYYLFGNVSSMIMQTSHQLMALAPKLTELGSSVAGSYATIGKANKMVVDARLKGGRYADSDMQKMIDLAGQRGDIGSWIQQEIDHNEDLQAVNRIRATSGKGLWEPFDLLKNKMYQGMNLMQRMYGVVPAYNSEVAFVASVLHLRKTQPNLKGDGLYNEARFLKDTTLYPGGKETRPGFFQASGQNQTSSFVLPRSAAQTVWSLNTYANGLTTMMGNLLRKSFNPKGMTPAQATQVRKATVQMFSTQIALAGVLGLPFAQAMLYGLQQMFPEHNIEQGIRDTLGQLEGDNEAFGNVATALTTGIPSAMDYAPDLGSRFALAGTLHVSPYGGVGWQQLLGPAGGLVARLFHGVQAGARGEPMQTVQDLMPNGFQRLWKTLEQQNTYTTQNGRLLADDLRPEEVVARAIGFTPSRVSRIQDAERLSKITEDAEKSQQARWTGEQVGLMRQGKDVEVQQNVAQRVAETKGARTAQQLQSDVAREFERETLPVDTRRLGSRATVLAQKSLKGVLGTQSTDVSNMQRVQMQQEIMQRLGGRPNMGQFRRASAIDNLLQLYPHLTTPQAELLLTHSAASRPTQDLYSELTAAGE